MPFRDPEFVPLANQGAKQAKLKHNARSTAQNMCLVREQPTDWLSKA